MRETEERRKERKETGQESIIKKGKVRIYGGKEEKANDNEVKERGKKRSCS